MKNWSFDGCFLDIILLLLLLKRTKNERTLNQGWICLIGVVVCTSQKDQDSDCWAPSLTSSQLENQCQDLEPASYLSREKRKEKLFSAATPICLKPTAGDIVGVSRAGHLVPTCWQRRAVCWRWRPGLLMASQDDFLSWSCLLIPGRRHVQEEFSFSGPK